MRAALYARFSTDLQRAESIADQLTACRTYCARNGLTVVSSFEDAAISGASMANRPGLAALKQAARGGSFDVVVTEALDRLSRSQGDVATLFEDLRHQGVGIRTISEGEVEDLAIGLKGTMNALFLRETARKTKRGMIGVGVPAPRGGQWNASTIHENAARGNGLLHNELYRGRLVWGRQTWSKSRETGTRRSRPAPASDRITTPVPQLRIVSDEVWEGVRRRYEAIASGPQTRRPETARRPVRLLSELVRCGVCDGSMVIGGAQGRLTCSLRRERGPAACTNGRGVRSDEVEARVATAFRQCCSSPRSSKRRFGSTMRSRVSGARRKGLSGRSRKPNWPR